MRTWINLRILKKFKKKCFNRIFENLRFINLNLGNGDWGDTHKFWGMWV